MFEPRVGPDEQDPDRSVVYDVEEEWAAGEYGMTVWGDVLEPVRPDMVPGFYLGVLVADGCDVVEPPQVVFDISSESDFSGAHGGADGVIHLHPDLTGPTHLLHELSHWLDDRDGHGPIFQANMVRLVDVAIGREAAVELLCAYRSGGLMPNRWRLPDDIDAADQA